MFHTVYKFDIMSELDIERELESVLRREQFFTLLVNNPSYYTKRKQEIEAHLLRLQNELDAIYANEQNKCFRLEEAKDTVKVLCEALRKKQLERMEKEKLARQEAAKKKAEECKKLLKERGAKLRIKKLTFEEKLAKISPEQRKLFTDEQWKSYLE